MSDKATEAHNRMQAEKVHAVNSMKAMARRHKVQCEESAAIERYQKARIAALEIEVEELTRERDEARRRLCAELLEVEGHPIGWNGARGAKGIAERLGWDCFKENTND